jgi:hypothetical protein
VLAPNVTATRAESECLTGRASAFAPMSRVSRWWLDDAEARHAEAPMSFFIPPAAKRNALSPGDAVKLLFAFESTLSAR